MDKVEFIPVEEAKALKRVVKKSKIFEHYESILQKLPEGQAGRVNAKEEKANTIKNRLIRVGKLLDMTDLQVKRTGDIVTFWRE